jgi:hypothetical protein
MSRRTAVVLAVLAGLELASLAVLLVNLATVHARPITQAMGPVHGAVYLAVVVIVVFAPGLRLRDRVLGCLPVVGGSVAVWSAWRARSRTRRDGSEPTATSASSPSGRR